MSVDLTKGATVELVKTLSDDLRTKDDNTKYSSAGAAMRDKANINGYYEDLVSGGTEQILSSVYEEDSEPYLFRTSGGSIDIGDREEDTIVGVTVAWNQLVQNGNFESDTLWNNEPNTTHTIENGVLTITTGTANNGVRQNGFICVSGHKYLVYAEGKCEETKKVAVGCASNFGVIAEKDVGSAWTVISKVVACVASSNNTPLYIFGRNTTLTNAQIRNFNIFDLTQMFGSTIADYIYSLEQANAGAGVAWFKKLFPKPYYPYDAGSLKHVEGLSEHKMRGFNAWDEEYRNGYYTNTGVFNPNSNYIANKNPIEAVPNTSYFFHVGSIGTAGRDIFFYDADMTYLSKTSLYSETTFTTPANAKYMNFNIGSSYGGTYKNDICINLHWDGERDGEYEPYVKHSYPLDDSLTLRGIPKLDANNNLYYDGDTYEADGTVTRKYGIVDLGTLTWTKFSVTQGTLFRATISTSVDNDTTITANAICTKYPTVAQTSRAEKTLSSIGHLFDIIDSSYTTEQDFKTAMSGVYLVYELATPTTEEAEPYQTPQIVDDFGTEEYVTDSIVPVGHVTKYMPNLKAKLEMAPDSPSENGDFVVRHTNGQNEYVPLVIPTELPTMPSEDGTYKLKVTVTDGTPVVSWESE